MESYDTFLLSSCGGTGLRKGEGTPAQGDISLHKRFLVGKCFQAPAPL